MAAGYPLHMASIPKSKTHKGFTIVLISTFSAVWFHSQGKEPRPCSNWLGATRLFCLLTFKCPPIYVFSIIAVLCSWITRFFFFLRQKEMTTGNNWTVPKDARLASGSCFPSPSPRSHFWAMVGLPLFEAIPGRVWKPKLWVEATGRAFPPGAF